MEHIPAIHAAKVGMRYPARIKVMAIDCLCLELDVSNLAPGRCSILEATLLFDRTVHVQQARSLRFEDQFEIALVQAPRYVGSLIASLPADPAWLTWNNGTVRQLAQGIRESGDTVLLPVLADALEEAGCTERDLLARCRAPEGDDLNWLLTLLATQE